MRRRGLLAALLAAVALFAALGVWQVERLRWKLALIAQVEARLAAPPVPPPAPSRWRAIGPADAYTRLAVTGTWRRGADAYVQAVTDLGPGYWVMSPLATDRGTILVNRGFVPTGLRGRAPPPAGPARVAGLLRIAEPGGGFLRTNDPAGDRWYSRDVAAIAQAKRLGAVAPFFIDAGPSAGWPRGGLTVVRFRNAHLVYALTWFALAALSAWFAWRSWRIR